MDALVQAAQNITSALHDHVHPGKHAFVRLRGQRGELLHAVQENLRLRSYRPYIRQPMSRWAKARLWLAVRVNSGTTGKQSWWQGQRFYWGCGALLIIAVALAGWGALA
jgi:hypothetical protein